MKGLRFIPSGTHVPFLRVRMIAFILSGLLTIASIGLFFTVGLNYGIDFRGGTLIEIRNKSGPVDLAEIRAKVSNIGLGDVQIQEFGAPTDVLIRIEQQPGGEKEQQKSIAKIKETLGDSVDYRRVEVVGPTVSGELIQSGAIAVLVAIFSVLLYIWFRFEWQFSVGAITALVHDVILTIGLFCLLQLEFGLSIIAAILTIVGYSLNDTVVVYDRVRENLRKYKKMPLVELLDLSLNETLSRTILTSVTTLIALLSLYIFGGQVIRGFTFAMIWGVVVGTYSSVFVAAPLLLKLDIKREWSGVSGAKAKEPASQSD
ncbi:MAG TPA: protein translocase subunit SecF [Rhizobiales bacterium]|nr:preprotein translocase subunit SecF [bacterium BMS3Bbin10]HDO52889.1 protein translocase subunit SecF [Hyphomicrobiales bacterium]